MTKEKIEKKSTRDAFEVEGLDEVGYVKDKLEDEKG
jgi:hypothetical protein